MNKDTPTIDSLTIANEMKESLIRNFGNAIKRVVLCGSQARGTARADSDYNILVILEYACDWRMKRRISHVCYDVDLQYDVVTDVNVLSVDELRSPKGRQPFLVNALNEGIAI